MSRTRLSALRASATRTWCSIAFANSSASGSITASISIGGHQRAHSAHDAHPMPRRTDTDWQGPRPRQAGNRPAQGLRAIFVGDACEEDDDELIPAANELGQAGVPVFMFQEGNNRAVEHTFREVTRVTHGAYCRFDSGSAKQLGELLKAV